LRHYRVSAGLSQEALAERAGLSVRGISDLERGARTFPRLETVRMLADALELNEGDRAILLGAARPELAADESVAPKSVKPEKTIRLRALPIPPTRLIGRETEIERVVTLYRSGETRLITLTGQGGIGKSRLGLAIARDFRASSEDGWPFWSWRPCAMRHWCLERWPPSSMCRSMPEKPRPTPWRSPSGTTRCCW
jgi:transcriptional regulator with XRE-family HTH domain